MLRFVAATLSLAAAFLFGFQSGRLGDQPSSPSVLDEAMRSLREHAATEVGEDDLTRAAIEGMLERLGDRYATYFAGSEFAEFQRLLDGRYTGVGLWLGPGRGAHVEVLSVLPASPAAAAGLRVGDEVVSVGGQPVVGREVGEVVGLLRGRVGTPVAVGIRRDGTVRAISLRREEVATRDVTVDAPAAGVSRIRIAAFTRGVGREVRAAVERSRGQGVLLDLRGNPGGLLHEAVEVASAFLDGGPVVSYRGRGVEPQTFTAEGHGDASTSLVVLVDGGTASAAEVVAAALQERGRAVVVGSTTYGKGSVQQAQRLSDGSALEITVARYFTPSGRSLDGSGITPDVDVLATADGAAAERRGIEVLRGILAGSGPAKG